MKSKKLRLLTILLFLLPLCVVLLGAGCEKDDINLSASGIIGEWELFQYSETCVGFGNVHLEITSDSLFKRYSDGELTLESTFSIKEGTMGYDTIFFHNSDADFSYNLFSFLGNDTLKLDLPIYYLTQPCNYFKRKN